MESTCLEVVLQFSNFEFHAVDLIQHSMQLSLFSQIAKSKESLLPFTSTVAAAPSLSHSSSVCNICFSTARLNLQFPSSTCSNADLLCPCIIYCSGCLTDDDLFAPGQRQCLSIARALYSNADVFLLDDPLSALDSKVGRKVFDQAIR
jgi:hypothetical protein